ncbi:MAG: hypothetical protein F4089_15345 [Gammaproteobacteria bacterium]|nr:hypothetical protein [Gammaproteobacteria bacterium]
MNNRNSFWVTASDRPETIRPSWCIRAPDPGAFDSNAVKREAIRSNSVRVIAPVFAVDAIVPFA